MKIFSHPHSHAPLLLALTFTLGACSMLQPNTAPVPAMSNRNLPLIGSAAAQIQRNEKQAAKSTSNEDGKLTSAKMAEGMKLARLLRDQGQFQAASEVYAQLDQRNGLQALELLEYATVAVHVQTPQESLALFGRTRRAFTTSGQTATPTANVALCNGIARAKLALGQTDAALADFDCVLRIDPDNLTALNGKGVLLDMQGQHEQARQLFSKASELDPADSRTANNLALSYLSSGNTRQAIRLLSQNSNVRQPSLKLNLAFAYLLDQQTTRARQTLLDMMSPRLADAAMLDLEKRRDSIRQGQAIAEELLTASRQLVLLQEQGREE